MGKKAVYIRVVQMGNWHGDGERACIGYTQAARRTILRLLDGQLCYLLGALLIRSPGKKQCLGDIVAQTVVVRE
ncbi:MAG TPA: hypothetical protein VEG44_04865 [Candidatus Acidoferrales bacterium]|nr:hypothetical protein [Candidatus Acidoferrales bacterium]